MSPPADIDLERIRRVIERWQAGVDREAGFQTLVESYYRQVRYYFAKRGFSDEDARDLTQETFFGVYRGLPRFRRDARFDTWLYQIAANMSLKALRDRNVQKRRMETEARSMTDLPREVAQPTKATEPAPLGRVLAEERRQRLRRAIATLPVKMRTCLAMRVYQDLSYREIAAAMRLSVETVKAHLYQARQRLKQELDEEPGGDRRESRKETR
jgi:RNA polymerase sigma-70 factor, ECF subfamily